MQHLDEGTIHAWLDGALSSDEQMLIEQHVRQCAACATLVADARGMIAGATRIVSALDNVPGGVIPAKREVAPTKAQASLWRSLRLTPFRAGLAATLMIAVASMFAVRHDSTNRLVVPIAQTPTEDRPAAAPTPPPQAAPSKAAPTKASPIPAPRAARSADTSVTNVANKDLAQASVAVPRRDAIVVPAASSGAAASPPPVNAARDEVTRSNSAQAKAAAPALQPPEGNIKGLESATTHEARARELLDSAVGRARAQDSLSGGRGVFPRRPGAFTSAMQLQEVVVTSATLTQSAALFVGCYRMLRDSIAPLLAVPERFGLDRTGSPPATRNVVRSVGPTGDMDTVLTTATWQSTSRGAATVTWTSGVAPVTLQLALASTGVTANATVDGGNRPLQVARVACTR